jgi:hypothetical protein
VATTGLRREPNKIGDKRWIPQASHTFGQRPNQNLKLSCLRRENYSRAGGARLGVKIISCWEGDRGDGVPPTARVGRCTGHPPSRCQGAMGWDWRKSPKALMTAIINRVL